ncbi:glycosyltransferase family 4 protein [Algivirga pacifica]|uniref:Glycosyltransferase family 4 protein n=1 Tax=Algivirga pacifica TaxID=1162670 RepID=A0ABP9DJ92_9BACT
MKKVLLVSYYWPPSAGIAVLRTLKLAKYLRENGWEPIVYTAENPDYPGIDHSNDKDIPEGITVIKQPIFEPYKYYRKLMGKQDDANVVNALVANDDKESLLHKLSVWVRSNFFIPDARAFWIVRSVNYLTKYLKDNPVDAMWAIGPPHTNNVIACELKKRLGIPWLADFQDPWTQVDYFEKLILTSWANRKHHRLEQEVFEYADHITIVSHQWKKDLQAIGAREVSVIPWGFDHEDYQELNSTLDQKLTLLHTGLIGEDRNPATLLQAVRELLDENDTFKQYFRLKLIGEVDLSVRKVIDELGLQDWVEVQGNIPRQEVLQKCANAQVLLLLLNQAKNASGRIPGKLFEYLGVSRPILCLGDTTGDTANIIREAGAGVTLTYDNKQDIKQMLLKYLEDFLKEGKVPHETNQLESLSNRYLTKQVAGILDQISGDK